MFNERGISIMASSPTRSMPHGAYQNTYVNPMHYFIDDIRTFNIRGGTIQAIAYQIFALLSIEIVKAAGR